MILKHFIMMNHTTQVELVFEVKDMNCFEIGKKRVKEEGEKL